MQLVRPGDTLKITRIDWPSRSVLHQVTPGRAMLGMLSVLAVIAEFEHTLISERTRDGLAAVQARGRTGGQQPKLGPRHVQLAQQRDEETDQTGKTGTSSITEEFGVPGASPPAKWA